MANHLEVKKRRLMIHPTTPKVLSVWPSVRYHPKTGQSVIFQSEDEVPEGWVDRYAKTAKGRAEAEAAAAESGDMYVAPVKEAPTKEDGGYAEDEPDELEAEADITVAEIKRRLDARKVPYAASANKDTLYQLLEENWVIEEKE